MLEQFAIEAARIATRVIELTGITIIAVGAFVTLALFLWRMARGADRSETVAQFRSTLGLRSCSASNSSSPPTSSIPSPSSRP